MLRFQEDKTTGHHGAIANVTRKLFNFPSPLKFPDELALFTDALAFQLKA